MKSFHNTRNAKNAFLHGVNNGIGPFGKRFPSKKPIVCASNEDQKNAPHPLEPDKAQGSEHEDSIPQTADENKCERYRGYIRSIIDDISSEKTLAQRLYRREVSK